MSSINWNQSKHLISEALTTQKINLKDCRPIVTDVIDCRGENEVNYCLNYLPDGYDIPVLTRVQVRILIYKKLPDGKTVFLTKKRGHRLQLPGGGFDASKDKNIIDTACRECEEEFNFKLKNIIETNIHTWQYREDKWVVNHVKNEKDVWNGYYSFYIVAEYDKEANNTNPEEKDKWTWLDINYLLKDTTLKSLSSYISKALSEDWGNQHGEQDLTLPNIISYCCENFSSLDNILKSHYIYSSQAEIFKPGIKGKTNSVLAYPYVSFSKQLYSHPYRRPLKWPVGISFYEDKLKEKYELYYRDHVYNSLIFDKLFVDYSSNTFIVSCSYFGYIEVNEQIFNILYDAFSKKSEAKGLEDDADSTVNLTGFYKNKNLTKRDAWSITTSNTNKARGRGYFALNSIIHPKLENCTVVTFKGQKGGPSRFVIHFSELSKPDKQMVLDYLLNETYYNEGEWRIWCFNHEDKIIFSDSDVEGLILPIQFKDLFESFKQDYKNGNVIINTPLENIFKYAIDKNLTMHYHHACLDIHIPELNKDKSHKITSTQSSRNAGRGGNKNYVN